MHEQERQWWSIDKCQLGKELLRGLGSFRKNQCKMQQQRRRQQPSNDARPVHFIVERVELSAVVE